MGPVIIMAHKGRLVYCNWDKPECLKKLRSIEKWHGYDFEEKDIDLVEDVKRQLEEYFKGIRQTFDVPIELTGTNFQKLIWENILTIAYGHISTYKDLSCLSNNPKGYRAVARACGANPIALIIPCHRVVGEKGKLGGYTGGLDIKIQLLEHECRKIFGEIKKTP